MILLSILYKSGCDCCFVFSAKTKKVWLVGYLKLAKKTTLAREKNDVKIFGTNYSQSVMNSTESDEFVLGARALCISHVHPRTTVTVCANSVDEFCCRFPEGAKVAQKVHRLGWMHH